MASQNLSFNGFILQAAKRAASLTILAKSEPTIPGAGGYFMQVHIIG
jgi:hypothetical protein